MKTKSHLIAIYDEDPLRREMLHNKLEYLGYPISFSCSAPDKLFDYLKKTPALLLINLCWQNEKKSLACLYKLKKAYSKLKILAYGYSTSQRVEDRLTAFKIRSYTTLSHLISVLEEVLPDHEQHLSISKGIVSSLPPDHPYNRVILHKKSLKS